MSKDSVEAVQHEAFLRAHADNCDLEGLPNVAECFRRTADFIAAVSGALETTDAYSKAAINFRAGKASFAELNAAALAKEDARAALAQATAPREEPNVSDG